MRAGHAEPDDSLRRIARRSDARPGEWVSTRRSDAVVTTARPARRRRRVVTPAAEQRLRPAQPARQLPGPRVQRVWVPERIGQRSAARLHAPGALRVTPADPPVAVVVRGALADVLGSELGVQLEVAVVVVVFGSVLVVPGVTLPRDVILRQSQQRGGPP